MAPLAAGLYAFGTEAKVATSRTGALRLETLTTT